MTELGKLNKRKSSTQLRAVMSLLRKMPVNASAICPKTPPELAAPKGAAWSM